MQSETGERLKQGVAALQRGDTETALACSEAVLRVAPSLSVAHLVRGRALLAQGSATAVEALERALALDPRSAEAELALGAALAARGDMQDAWAHHLRAFELAPRSASVIERGAGFLLDQGELDTALELYRAAAALGSAEAAGGVLEVLERRGDLAAAAAIVAEGRLDPGRSPRLALAVARLLGRVGRQEEALTLLESAAGPCTAPAWRAKWHYALGECHDRRGAPAEAFGHWRAANELRGGRFDAAALARRVERILTEDTRARILARPRARHGDGRPVFIVGAPRSGTTLVEELLATSPAVHARGELDAIPALVATLARDDAAAVEAAARQYLAGLAGLGPQVRCATDKLPHNAFHLGVIAQLFPQARVVHVTRDPLDTGLSIYSRDLHATHDYATDLGAIGSFLGAHARLLAHGREHLPLARYELAYERLVAEPEAETRALFGFLDLSWDESVLRFHESRRAVRTASFAQVRRPLHGGSVGRAQAYRAWLGPLAEALRAPATPGR
ncbi:MAG TPA: sulfotransferase [Planctomycetota bacterium]